LSTPPDLASAIVGVDLDVSAKFNWHYDQMQYFKNETNPKLLQLVQYTILSQMAKKIGPVPQVAYNLRGYYPLKLHEKQELNQAMSYIKNGMVSFLFQDNNHILSSSVH